MPSAPVPTSRVARAGLDVAAPLAAFLEEECLSGSGVDTARFWTGLAAIVDDLTAANTALLRERTELQDALDAYHRAHPGRPKDREYRSFLTKIGYLLPEPGEFTITTADVDSEIAQQAGPQLVVPLLNARFALNAANARWGSLYDALYGTDAVARPPAPDAEYDPVRGAAVVARARAFLDAAVPLREGTHADSAIYRVEGDALVVELADGRRTAPADPDSFVGYAGDPRSPSAVVLRHHGLHIEIVFDPASPIGAADRAGIRDVVLESAVTTIMDLEDSVAAVDVEDKVLGYRNWRGLLTGTLTEVVVKGGSSFVRSLADDRHYTGPDGTTVSLPGRSLLLVRNVGLLMTTDAVRDRHGAEVYEGILDAVVTALCAVPDLRGEGRGRNSRTGSIYIVKPKLHGPKEVAFTVELFARVEQLLGLAASTIKLGIMDEERRTTANLRASIAAASDRVVFINTGFLDRTGDEIHTSMHAGTMVPKNEMRAQPFLQAYEAANVDAGLRAGFSSRAQIGKGMWAMPDLMHEMLEQKAAHPAAGASTAWVPSPTAATLHALHYHDIDVAARQRELQGRTPPPLRDLLTPPLLAEGRELHAEEIRRELDTDVQSILGYVVRWVDQGVGCSKVPDIDGVNLMEDRATLRISSQLLANWLVHGVIGVADVDESLERLAAVVDRQNRDDPRYEPLLGDHGRGPAFQAARELILEGARQPSGYTEPILHRARRLKKGG